MKKLVYVFEPFLGYRSVFFALFFFFFLFVPVQCSLFGLNFSRIEDREMSEGTQWTNEPHLNRFGYSSVSRSVPKRTRLFGTTIQVDLLRFVLPYLFPKKIKPPFSFGANRRSSFWSGTSSKTFLQSVLSSSFQTFLPINSTKKVFMSELKVSRWSAFSQQRSGLIRFL